MSVQIASYLSSIDAHFLRHFQESFNDVVENEGERDGLRTELPLYSRLLAQEVVVNFKSASSADSSRRDRVR